MQSRLITPADEIAIHSAVGATWLETCLVFSGALSKAWDYEKIIHSYPRLLQEQLAVERITYHFLKDGFIPPIEDSAKLLSVLHRYPANRTIIATSYHGHPIAFAAACAGIGLPLTCVHGAISPNYQSQVEKSSLELISIQNARDIASLIGKIEASLARSRYLMLAFDAPTQSKRKLPLLDFSVPVANLVAILAKRNRLTVLPLFTYEVGQQMIGGKLLDPINNQTEDVSTRLFSHLDVQLRSSPYQYKWTKECLMLADPDVKRAALEFLPAAIKFREEHFA